ncbi:MAG TPA: hypothetical protein PLP29_07035 [Candidatus Ozemobacteraceae bacterium]|nr:hypothetical protein [Candidatus Ozemobacteraceae bacterium]
MIDEKQTPEDEKEDEKQPGHGILANFNQNLANLIQEKLKTPLIKIARAMFSSPNGDTVAVCKASKEHSPDENPNYWFGFYVFQHEILSKAEKGYIVFGCGSPKQTLLIPYKEFSNLHGGMHKTNDKKPYWHVVIYRNGDSFILHR